MKEIQLSKGKCAIVDDEDYAYVSQWKWYYDKGYATRVVEVKGIKQRVYMHRVIVNAKDGMEVDHIDRDGLNNTKSNLRQCTHSQNSSNRGVSSQNTSGYKGVGWHKRSRKWYAKIKTNKKEITIGAYLDPVDAAKAYDKKAKELFGEFAFTNFGGDD